MAVLTYVIDPLNILTMGLLSGDPLNLITDGFVTVTIEEEIIEVPAGDGGGDFGIWPTPTEQKKKKKITATVFIGNKKYEETVIVNDLKLNIKDVKLQLNKELNEVKIKIILPKGVE